MRIIYLHQYFNTPDMPGSTRSYEIGRRLVAAGHRVEMIASWRRVSRQRRWFVTDEAGIRVHWLPVQYSNHMSHARRIWAFCRFAAGAARRAAGLEGDVIFASSTPLTIALPAVYAARRKAIPMVFEVRDLWPELPIAMGALGNPVLRAAARWLERFAYANAARVIALSAGMAAGVARAGYPEGRIAVVPNGADLDVFKRSAERGQAFRRMHRIPGDTMLVGYVGTLGRINDASYLVRVAAALKDDRRLTFLMVGDGQERAKVEGLARKLGVLDHNLLLLAQMPKGEIPAVLSAVDVATSLCLPLPELEANSANKVFDAMAAGCCVAINYGGWQADLLTKTGAGIRLETDPQRGAAQLAALAGDPGGLQTAGRNARRLAEERFSRDALAAQLEIVVTEAVAEVSRAKV